MNKSVQSSSTEEGTKSRPTKSLTERFDGIRRRHAKGPSQVTVQQVEAFMISSIVDQLEVENG
jgi:hypothetical protein